MCFQRPMSSEGNHRWCYRTFGHSGVLARLAAGRQEAQDGCERERHERQEGCQGRQEGCEEGGTGRPIEKHHKCRSAPEINIMLATSTRCSSELPPLLLRSWSLSELLHSGKVRGQAQGVQPCLSPGLRCSDQGGHGQAGRQGLSIMKCLATLHQECIIRNEFIRRSSLCAGVHRKGIHQLVNDIVRTELERPVEPR